MMSTHRSIGVLGAGSWGATLAGMLSANGHSVSLWEFDAAAAEALQKTRRLNVLPGLRLPERVRVTSRIGETLNGSDLVVCAVPSQVVRSTMQAAHASGALGPNAVIVSVTKGLEESTRARMSQVIGQELRIPAERVLVLSGPSHAEEVCDNKPTAVVLAGERTEVVASLIPVFSRDRFRVYPHADVLGVELCGAIKNVFAIACGIADGLGLGDNTRAALMTRGLNEMVRIGVPLGAQMLTFFGLAGVGDLIVTCLSRHSRNHTLGKKIGRGQTPSEALAGMTMVAEGFKTAPAAHRLAADQGLDCPLLRETFEILHQGKDPRQSLQDLMQREVKNEWTSLMTTAPGGRP